MRIPLSQRNTYIHTDGRTDGQTGQAELYKWMGSMLLPLVCFLLPPGLGEVGYRGGT